MSYTMLNLVYITFRIIFCKCIKISHGNKTFKCVII